MSSILRTDILPSAFEETPQQVRIIVEHTFNNLISRAVSYEKTKTPEASKNIIEALEIISNAVRDYDIRTHKTEDAQIELIYSKPDNERYLEVISAEIIKREPGMWGQGSPFENNVKALRPILRDYQNDDENPNYRKAILGYYYDNLVRLTCWARTNKVANERALWLEDVMEEYTWYYVYSGINRVLYQGRASELTHTINGNIYYGRPIDYFIRTEKLRTISEKTLEEICFRLNLGSM